MLPIDGKSGNLMSLIRCGMFISLTADTARAGAAAMPACKTSTQLMNYFHSSFNHYKTQT